MTRRGWLVVGGAMVVMTIAVLLVISVGDGSWRRLFARGNAPPTAAPAIPGTHEMGTSTPTPGTTGRGDVMIDARRQQLIGVRTEAVSRTPITQGVRAVGVVTYDETRQFEINTKIDGWVRDLYADYTGKAIRAGDPLFTLYSPELLTTESEYLLARRGHAHAESAEVAAVRDYSARLVDAARQRLLLWDLTESDLQDLDQKGEATGLVTFRAPVGGVVVEKAAVKGMRVMAGQRLFRVADLSTVWVEADIYERDLAQIRIGLPVSVTLDAYAGETFPGRTTYLYPTVNDTTRTAKVRVQLANPKGRLKPGMYANVEIRGANRPGLTVAANAIVDSGKEQIVFVAQGEGYFVPRRVTVGRRLDDRVEVLDGLMEGEQVASSATFFLDSESQLRGALQNYEPPPSASSDAASPALDVTFRTEPDPPRTGDTTLVVGLKDSNGQPIADADVKVVLFMPPMPTMNMPAARSEATLVAAGGGLYRGTAEVMIPGRWTVTVNVARGGNPLGARQFAVVAK